MTNISYLCFKANWASEEVFAHIIMYGRFLAYAKEGGEKLLK